MWFEKCCCLLLLCLHCGVTGRWALWWERLMVHLYSTNHSCTQSNICRTKGRCRKRGKCLYNRKRCLPLRAVVMMMMVRMMVRMMMMILCVWIGHWSYVCTFLHRHQIIFHFCVCLCESGNVWQPDRSWGQVDESWGTHLGNVHIWEIVQVKS